MFETKENSRDTHNKDAGHDEEDSDAIQVRHDFVSETNGETRAPGNDDVGDKDVPWTRYEGRMVDSIHLHDNVSLRTLLLDD